MSKPKKTPTQSKPATSAGSDDRVWSPIFILITVTALLSFMAGQGLNSGSSVYLARVGYPSAIAGTSAFIFSIAAAVIRIVCGQVLDKRGRYGVLMIGCALFVASTLAPLLRLSSEVFLAMRVVQGVGFAMVTTTSTTMASDVLPVAHLGSGLGFFGLGQALAMSIGPAIALALVETNPPENLFIIVSVLAIGATVCSALSRYERHPERLPKTCGYRMRVESQAASQHEAATASQPDAAIASQSEATTSQSNTAASQPDAAATSQPNATASAPEAGDSHKGKPTIGAFLAQIFEIRALCGALPMFAYAPIVGFNIYFVGLFAAEMGLPNGGFYYTLAAIGMIVVRLGSHLFMDRVQPLKILGVGLALGMISLVLLLMITLDPGESHLIAFYVAGFCYGVCGGLVTPVNQAVAVKNTPPERWGAANALVLFALDVSMGVASVAWGIANDLVGFSVTVCACMVWVVITFLLAWRLFPKN